MKFNEVPFIFSQHYFYDNQRRELAIKSIGGNGNNIVAKFYWDKGHNEGAEWHWITDNGIIIVTNVHKHNGMYVTTKLIARPNQLTRYCTMGKKNELTTQTMKMKNWLMPQKILNLARQHQLKGLNFC